MTANLIASIPTLRVSNIEAAEAFYCQQLGFTKAWAYQPASPEVNPCYMGVQREGVWLHISSFSGDGVFGAVVTIRVRDVDALFAEFSAKGIKFDPEPVDQTWGNREMYLRDADGNQVRFQQVEG